MTTSTRTAALLSLALALLASLSLVGCNKPSDSACRKAIANMRELIGTNSPTSNTDIEGDVRRCKGGSKKKAVECAAAAKSIDELRACDFMKIPSHAHDGSGSGSAMTPTPTPPDPGSNAMGSATGSDSAGSAGSAATGSDAAGSSAAGSAAAGSAAAGSAAAGSAAAGSAAAGSAAAGSAAGSATK